MFEVKSIKLEQKISNENEIILLFNTDSTFPCLFPLMFSLRVIRFQSLSTQYSDLMALKDWYIFWYKKYSISFCESFYSSNYNFELIQDEIDNFITFLENNNDLSNVVWLRVNSTVNYKNISNKIRTLFKFYTYLMDDYLTVKKQPHIDRKEIEKIKSNIKKYMEIKKKNIRKFTKTIHGEKKYLFKSMTNEMVKVLYETIAPSSSNNTNPFNPFKNRPTQFRNFLVIHLMLNYGLRVGELMLLTVNSMKKSVLNDTYSLIITNTDDENDDRRRKPKIKNEFSYRVITLQERDYRFINIYIKEIRSDINSDILFTSLKPPHSSLSYSSINKIFKIIDKNIKYKIPHHFDNKAFDSIDSITPHVCRHTWAYLMLNYSFKKYENMDKLGNSINNIGQNSLDKAQDDLRVLGGWSPTSLMPTYYGKRFIVERANISNLERIIEMSFGFEKTI
ncbi:site-specific integrase [Acinetobacter sp. BY484]|uniref:site-specific integrase n=1 Tax=Acinetobacter sp. BY484 TaxID=2820674 RepID=UPI001C21869A|nr:site-specific integrase [Acinetobacter sp. BY484]